MITLIITLLTIISIVSGVNLWNLGSKKQNPWLVLIGSFLTLFILGLIIGTIQISRWDKAPHP